MKDNYLTVSALTKYLKRKLETDKHLKEVLLKGEISNFKHHSRGHMYLTLKDERSRVQAVMFAGNNRSLKFTPENGMNVLVKGELGVYEPQGQYQLYIQQMEPDGIGALYLAYEQLKDKLSKEGLFEPLLKKPIPTYPRRIGVITSPTGAAVRDILITIKRRYPLIRVSLFPVLVQGERSADSIVNAIQTANKFSDFDVLIVGRGGGSIEELWSFNEEKVARAISQSAIPIISAVGHETDFTISDLVADLRAATPTAAAELAVPSKQELKDRVSVMNRSLNRSMATKVARLKENLVQLQESYAFKYPGQMVKQREQELDKNVEKLAKSLKSINQRKKEQFSYLDKRLQNQHPAHNIQKQSQQLKQQVDRLQRAFDKELQLKQNKFTGNLDKLALLNPLNTMKRGYSISFKQDGKVINSVGTVGPGEQITVKLADGSLDCQIWGIEEKENE